ncbi:MULTISPECIES: enoyl-CoA hydratase/isomerase family protein [unclassified Cupriavidus]|uniref:enoyl-CoA hydratase/isomerase family protein n=1 Tax=unclassified Cupriavidus TaxID=2640874 RepID=UPI0010F4B389|nr:MULTISPECIES: enoyl-CoA hydratase/isomerase family protein [unclassified Cupriavidus]MWL85942.1 enoyl-CoA hydratase/isomerase family protein [Cupriavidus sp. SW-Y-13]
MQFTTLTVTAERHLATVTLNRPDVRNAFNETVIAELTGAFRALGDTPEVRAIVLTGNGPAFCAGADLNWMKKMAGYSDDENRADALTLAQMLHTIWSCPKPVIARVQGDTYAGGMGLVAACDIAVAAESAHFCLSEAKLGLLPATISPYVIRAMGEQASRRYFITAERFDAAEALRLGFVHAVASPQALDEKVAEIAATLIGNSPNAVRESKRLVQEVSGREIDGDLLADTANRIASIRSSEEGREGVRSFLEKRAASWKV